MNAKTGCYQWMRAGAMYYEGHMPYAVHFISS